MRVNQKTIIISLFVAMATIGWFSYVFAAVPVIPVLNNKVSYIETIEFVNRVIEIDADTSYELSLEAFMTNLFEAFATREEEFQKSFEIAKIQKAREDVNKLAYETQRELTGQGIIIEVKDPVTGKDYTIKKEGRIITNPDDFLFEEPIQKARDFVYCYLAPWKHFAWEDDLRFCGELKLEGDKCTSQEVCRLLPFEKGKICPSDITRDKIKQRLLSGLVRKEHKWATAPPESWYSPTICENILNSVSCVDTQKCFTGQTCGKSLTNIETLGSEQQAQINSTHSTLSRPIAYTNDNTIYELQQAAGNPNNNPVALERQLLQQTENIINQYQTLRQAQYTAGQGIRPEKYLIAVVDYKDVEAQGTCTDRATANGTPYCPIGGSCREMDEEKVFGRPLTMSYDDRGYTDQTFWFDTENIISPAIVLLQKMAASAQAQFDLARQAYKYPPEDIISSTPDGETDGLMEQFTQLIKPSIESGTGILRPNFTELPAPWEDASDYAELPPEYFGDIYGEYPEEIGESYYLNRWYKDINQMYLPQEPVVDIKENFGSQTFSRILERWFCLEGPPGGGASDWKCTNERDPLNQ